MAKDKVQTTEPVKTETAVAEIPQPINLPAVPAMGFDDAGEQSRGAYISFPMSRSRKWVELKSEFADLQEYEPLLVQQKLGGEKYTRIADKMAITVWWVGGIHCWAQMNIETGAVIIARRNPPDDREQAKQYTELVEAVVLSEHNGVLVPARISLRNALATTGFALNSQRDATRTPEWATQYPGTVQYPPDYRFSARVTFAIQPSRRSPGFTYPVARIKVIPTDQSRYDLVSKFLTDPAFKSELAGTLQRYTERVEEIKSKLVG